MSDAEKERIEEALRQLQQQEQQTQNLIRIIQRTKPEDLEQERFKNMSEDEQRIFRRD